MIDCGHIAHGYLLM